MKRTQRNLLLFVVLIGGTLTGCVVRGGVYAHTEPQLVSVDSGVWVVEDHHEPVFYHDDFYWRYYGGTWYRSRVHNNSWVRVHTVPRAIVRIERPTAYVRYQARPGVRVRRGPARVQSHQPRRNERVRSRSRHEQPRVRDHRRREAPTVRDHRSHQRPKTRDHRRAKPKRRKDDR